MSRTTEVATAWSRLSGRCRVAAAREESPWILAGALLAGALVAMVIVPALPATGSDLEQARALGIVSRTTLEGYPKSADHRGYLAGMLLVVGAALGVWLAWANQAGAGAKPPSPRPRDGAGRRSRDAAAPNAAVPNAAAPVVPARPAAVWIEALVMLVAIGIGFFKLDMARNAWSNSWTLLSEEGEMMAWVDTLLRGGALFRDVYCLYGPLAKYPVAQLFTHFGPSLWLWRVWVFALNVPALLLVHWLLRRITRTRAAAAAGTLLIGLACASTVPAMSWSIARVALGLGAIAAFDTYRSTGRAVYLLIAGVVLGTSLGFSQEVGVCAGVAIAWLVAARWWSDRTPPRRWAGELAWVAGGFALVVGPLCLHFLALGTLDDAVRNLFVFPRVRLLGFAALRFPAFAPMLEQMLSGARDGRLAASVAAGRFYFCPAALAIVAAVLGVRLLAERDARRVVTPAAVCLFGMLVFQSAVSRPDGTHLLFVLPPALALVVAGVEMSVLAATSAAVPPSRRALAAGFTALWLAALCAYADVLRANLADYVKQAGLTLTGRFSRDHVAGFRTLNVPRAGDIQVPEAWAADFEATVEYVRGHTPASAAVWAYPNEPLVNFVAERALSNPFPLGLFAITRDQREQMVAAIERSSPPLAVAYAAAITVDGIGYDIALPEPTRELQLHFRLVRQFGPWQVLERVTSPS